MKRIFTGFVLAALSVATAQDIVTAKCQKYTGWGEQDLIYNQEVEISNGKNLYRFDLLQNAPGQNGKPYTFFAMTLPRRQFGFGYGPARFLQLSVNGISSTALQPKNEDFRPWQQGELRGAECRLNFDGTVIIVTVYMKPDSPVLWMKFTQPEKQLEPLKEAIITLQFVISGLYFDDKKSVVWENAYAHLAQTALRTLEQPKDKKEISLTPQDTYVIISDKQLDGSADDKGYGPSFIAFDYNSGVENISLDLADVWINHLHIRLKPDFKEFTVGVWEWKNRFPNADFMKMFEKEKSNFIITK